MVLPSFMIAVEPDVENPGVVPNSYVLLTSVQILYKYFDPFSGVWTRMDAKITPDVTSRERILIGFCILFGA